MKSEIQINNTAEEWQFDEPEERVATYERFREAVRRIGAVEAQRIVVNIRSTGGDVNDALLIHDALKQTGAHVTTRCYGYVASAATIIAQAASEGCREISANALYLIHTSVCATEGNAAELAGKTELLRQTDARIATIYAARSGRPAEEFEALMNENNGNGRWLSPEETVAAGLADRVIDTAERPAASLAKQITRGWRRLLAGIGLRDETPDEADRNILHFGEEEAAAGRQQQSALAAEELRRSVHATRTLPREDPSCGEAARTANERAYQEDARQFRKAL